MRQGLMAGLIIATVFNSGVSLALEKTQCSMPYISFKADKNKKYDWFSDHSITLVNETPQTQSYHVVYAHDIVNVTSGQQRVYDVQLESGQSFVHQERYTSKLSLSVKGTYTSRAITEIYLSGKKISNCVSKNNLTVF